MLKTRNGTAMKPPQQHMLHLRTISDVEVYIYCDHCTWDHTAVRTDIHVIAADLREQHDVRVRRFLHEPDPDNGINHILFIFQDNNDNMVVSCEDCAFEKPLWDSTAVEVMKVQKEHWDER